MVFWYGRVSDSLLPSCLLPCIRPQALGLWQPAQLTSSQGKHKRSPSIWIRHVPWGGTQPGTVNSDVQKWRPEGFQERLWSPQGQGSPSVSDEDMQLAGHTPDTMNTYCKQAQVISPSCDIQAKNGKGWRDFEDPERTRGFKRT